MTAGTKKLNNLVLTQRIKLAAVGNYSFDRELDYLHDVIHPYTCNTLTEEKGHIVGRCCWTSNRSIVTTWLRIDKCTFACEYDATTQLSVEFKKKNTPWVSYYFSSSRLHVGDNRIKIGDNYVIQSKCGSGLGNVHSI